MKLSAQVLCDCQCSLHLSLDTRNKLVTRHPDDNQMAHTHKYAKHSKYFETNTDQCWRQQTRNALAIIILTPRGCLGEEKITFASH